MEKKKVIRAGLTKTALLFWTVFAPGTLSRKDLRYETDLLYFTSTASTLPVEME